MNLIEDGDQVILQMKDTFRTAVIRQGDRSHLFDTYVRLHSAIGCAYGTLFEVTNESLCPVAQESASDGNGDVEDEFGEDNRSITDSAANQKLTSAEINKLKEAASSSEELISMIAENNQNFRQKTRFSREKYLAKKKQKYAVQLRILRPSVRLMLRAQQASGPKAVRQFRWDSLARIVHAVAPMPGHRLLVVDAYSSLLVAALLERVHAQCTLLQLYERSTYSLRAELGYFGAARYSDAVSICPLSCVAQLTAPSADEPAGKVLKASPNSVADELAAARRLVDDGRFDSLVVGTHCNPVPVVGELLKLLKPSRPFVVLSPHSEVLVKVQRHIGTLYPAKLAALCLTDTWLREYQVLDGRTHPLVKMDGASLYLLTGYVLAGVGEN